MGNSPEAMPTRMYIYMYIYSTCVYMDVYMSDTVKVIGKHDVCSPPLKRYYIHAPCNLLYELNSFTFTTYMYDVYIVYYIYVYIYVYMYVFIFQCCI